MSSSSSSAAAAAVALTFGHQLRLLSLTNSQKSEALAQKQALRKERE